MVDFMEQHPNFREESTLLGFEETLGRVYAGGEALRDASDKDKREQLGHFISHVAE